MGMGTGTAVSVGGAVAGEGGRGRDRAVGGQNSNTASRVARDGGTASGMGRRHDQRDGTAARPAEQHGGIAGGAGPPGHAEPVGMGGATASGKTPEPVERDGGTASGAGQRSGRHGGTANRREQGRGERIELVARPAGQHDPGWQHGQQCGTSGQDERAEQADGAGRASGRSGRDKWAGEAGGTSSRHEPAQSAGRSGDTEWGGTAARPAGRYSDTANGAGRGAVEPSRTTRSVQRMMNKKGTPPSCQSLFAPSCLPPSPVKFFTCVLFFNDKAPGGTSCTTGTRQRQEGADKHNVLVKSIKVTVATGTNFSFANLRQPRCGLLLPPSLTPK